jgi:hydroxymethylpyrimidine pyrophosphatase-like HAD family hydrolase
VTPWLVALDLDGTIVRWDYPEVTKTQRGDVVGGLNPGARHHPVPTVTPPVRAAIAAVGAAGHHVVIATGRATRAVIRTAQDLELTNGYAITGNGAMTIQFDGSERGYRIADLVTFDPEPVLAAIREIDPEVVLGVIEPDGGFLFTVEMPLADLGMEARVVRAEELNIPTTGVVVRTNEAPPPGLDNVLAEHGLHGARTTVGRATWIDVLPAGVSKATALEQLRLELGVVAENTMAIGDGHNDRQMLAWAARGVAMGQADEETKAAASEITSSVYDDGAAVVLRSLPGC